MEKSIRKELIGRGSDRYIKSFDRMREKKQIVSWSWPGFLLGHVWFFYRKMYIYAFLYDAILLLLPRIIPNYIAYRIVIHVCMIASGLFAKHLYKDCIENKNNVCLALKPEKQPGFIKAWGGTNLLLTIIYTVIWAGLAWLVNHSVFQEMGNYPLLDFMK